MQAVRAAELLMLVFSLVRVPHMIERPAPE
jgi:hypothetical protein